MIALAIAAADLVAKLLPIISRISFGGTATIEEQAAARAAYDKLVALGSDAFSGPEWQPSSETGPNPTNQP